MNQKIDSIIIGTDIKNRIEKYFESNLPNESLVVYYGKVMEKSSGFVLVVTDVVIPEKSDYTKRTPVFCSLSPQFLARKTAEHAKKAEVLLGILHEHPMEGLSMTDEQDGHMKMLKAGYIFCLTGYHYKERTAFYCYDSGFREVPLRIVDTERLDRQIRAYGYERQMLLGASAVLVVGCGGGGALLINNLATKGLRKIIAVDNDIFTKDSLNRLCIPAKFLGVNKAKALREMFSEFVEIEAFECRVEDLPIETFEKADVTAAFTDSFNSRLFVNSVSVKLGKPAVFLGSEVRADKDNVKTMIGSCFVYTKGSPCYNCTLSVERHHLIMENLNPVMQKYYASKYGLSSEVPLVPSLVELNSIVASMGSDQIMRILTKFAAPIPRQYIDVLTGKIITVKEKTRRDCSVCSPVMDSDIDQKDLLPTEQVLRFPVPRTEKS